MSKIKRSDYNNDTRINDLKPAELGDHKKRSLQFLEALLEKYSHQKSAFKVKKKAGGEDSGVEIDSFENF